LQVVDRVHPVPDDEAAERRQRPERDDEGIDARPGDDEAVDRPADKTDGDRQQEGKRDGDGGRILLGEQARHDSGDGEERADRQVGARGQDREGHPDRDDPDDGDLQQDQQRIVGRAELRDLDREEGDDRRQRDIDAIVSQRRGEGAARGGGWPGRAQRHQAAPAAGATPAASATRRSSEASPRAISPTSAPPRMTRIRSLIPRISGSSEQISSTARPCWARRSIVPCTSALATTSMPRVGSSRISTLGATMSERPSTTFCWLPPDSMATSWDGEAARIDRASTNFAAASPSRR